MKEVGHEDIGNMHEDVSDVWSYVWGQQALLI
jgi:hypothetical protein